jgi:hypothetical protein
MRTSLPALLVGALVLTVTTVATAGEPTPLGDNQLDMVTAGFWSVTVRDPNTGAVTLSPYTGKHQALEVGNA